VPEWFGIPEANAQYVADAGRLPSYLAVDGDVVVGVVLLAEHFPESRELHLLAVRRDRHREFYLALGFVAMTELQGIDWSGPTLILVRPL
jgi:hypothetical protein